MGVFIFIIFIVGIMLLAGMLYNISRFTQPFFYPPKRILRQRIKVMGVGGIIFILLGFILSWIAN